MLFCIVVMSAAGFGGYTYYENQKQEQMDPWIKANLAALADLEDLASSEGNPASYSSCLSSGGNWNMASVCQQVGFENTTCAINGEVTVLGVTVKGSYTSGEKYNVAWARYSCVESSGNCCIKQGLYTGGTKLA